jgi:hypothetical protein
LDRTARWGAIYERLQAILQTQLVSQLRAGAWLEILEWHHVP